MAGSRGSGWQGMRKANALKIQPQGGQVKCQTLAVRRVLFPGHGTHRLRSPPSLEVLWGPAFSLGLEDICSWEALIVTRGPFPPQPSATLLEILPAFGSHVTLSSYFPDPKALTLVIISTLPGGSRNPSTGNN